MQTVKKILILTEIKYLDFVSGHLASAETHRPKKSKVTKSIQVASIVLVWIFGQAVLNGILSTNRYSEHLSAAAWEMVSSQRSSWEFC